MWHAFRQALRELGYVEGQNLAYEYRYGEGTPDRLAEVAAELVRRPVDVIATFGTPPTYAAKEATRTIPIVMVGVGDPVRAGLVASFARPGGNITGNTVLSPDLGPKRMQILREAIANVSRVAFLINPDNASNVATLRDEDRCPRYRHRADPGRSARRWRVRACIRGHAARAPRCSHGD